MRSATALVAAALLAAACGGSGSAADTTSTTTTLPATSTTTSATATSGDPQAVLESWRADYGAPGALALVVGDGEEWFGVSGSADLAGSPIDASTRFRIASITKPVAAALVLDAVARGELTLESDVGEILPGTLHDDQPVTVRMLLSHTSGIFDPTNAGDPTESIARLEPDLRDEANAIWSAAVAGEQVVAPDYVLVALAEVNDREFDPGTSYSYSNINYMLAAMVLERVTGRSFSQLLDERLFTPLGLARTTILPPDTAPPDLTGYGTSTEDGSLVAVDYEVVVLGNGGGGGIISTAGELYTMIHAIVAGGFLPDDLAAEMRRPTAESGYSYGLGLGAYQLSCGTFHGHEGGVAGTASIALVSPEGGRAVVVATNLRSGEDPRLPALADALVCG